MKKEPVLPVDIQGQRILLVDDNRINRQILREQLKNWALCCRRGRKWRRGTVSAASGSR